MLCPHHFDESFDSLALVHGEVVHHNRPSSPQLRSEGVFDIALERPAICASSTPSIPPTGKRFSVEHFHWFRLADGKVVEHWNVRDDLGQMTQLGLIPKPESYS